jgi:hypothetical protein
MVAKAHPVNVEYEALAKNLLKGELKRRGVTYAQLAEKLAAMGVQENDPSDSRARGMSQQRYGL